MSDTIVTMKRYEVKYVLNQEQYDFLVEALKGHMEVDKYGLTSIASIYYDTPDYRLIRTSIEKPPYKEKIRLRSYGLADEDSTTFLEIKRKYEGIVYKRRISLLEYEGMGLIAGLESGRKDQIGRELEAFTRIFPHLEPKYFIACDRIAYYKENSDVRVTIDMNPRYRTTDLNLHTSFDGKPLLDDGAAILEVKVQHSVPLWLTSILTRGKIYQTSFSKVGEAHNRELAKKVSLLNKEKGERKYGFVV